MARASTYLNVKHIFFDAISSSEPFPWWPRHLARKFTRYAHRYPQDLWKTFAWCAGPLPANRCATRFSGVLLRFPSKAADDAYARHG